MINEKSELLFLPGCDYNAGHKYLRLVHILNEIFFHHK